MMLFSMDLEHPPPSKPPDTDATRWSVRVPEFLQLRYSPFARTEHRQTRGRKTPRLRGIYCLLHQAELFCSQGSGGSLLGPALTAHLWKQPHFRLKCERLEQSSLCYRVGPCWLSILNKAVCTCQSQTPNIFLPLLNIL